MTSIIETSYDSSENEFLDQSLSVWRGSTSSFEMEEDFLPVDLDLHTAASLGQFDCVRNYLKAGAILANRKNAGGWTPLMYAAYIGHDNIIHLLLDVGVDVELRNPRGQTCLMLAACCGNESVAYFLMSAGADLEARDELGWTALFHATYSGHQNVVNLLLENRADMNVREPRRGMTPFMQAALEGHEIIVHDFLQHGVDVNTEAYTGDTARSMAIYVGHTKVVTLIDNATTNRNRRMKTSENTGDPNARQRKTKGPSILDGPAAFARLRDKTSPPGSGDGDPVTSSEPRSRDLTSPDRDADSSGSWSSSGKDADDENDADDVFSQTGKVTVRSSSGSQSDLQTALRSVSSVTSYHDQPITAQQNANNTCQQPISAQQTMNNAQPISVENNNNNEPLGEVPKTLEELLEGLGLGKYMSVFAEQDVDLQVFLSLTDCDLKEVGIKLFGPRRKMTNAIARCHSALSCWRGKLEQVYADRLEAEMQELAIQLHKALDQADTQRAELLQERELRSVAEACLMEAWSHVRALAHDTKIQCQAVSQLASNARYCLRELLSRRQQFPPDLLSDSLLDRLSLDSSPRDVTVMADDHVIKFVDQMVVRMADSVLKVNNNTEKLLGKEVNFADSFNRLP